MLINRFAVDKEVSSILYFYEAICTSKPSYVINVNILDAIGYYGANERTLVIVIAWEKLNIIHAKK